MALRLLLRLLVVCWLLIVDDLLMLINADDVDC